MARAATLTRDAMFAEIVRQDEAKHDIVADTRRMSANVTTLGVEDGPNRVLLHIDNPQGEVESVVLNDLALGQMGTALGIPRKYLDRMLVTAPALLRTNIEHWLYQEPKRRLVRTFKPETPGDGYTGRAFLSDRYRRLDNIEIARKIFPVFDDIPGLTFHQAAFTDTNFYLHAVLPRMERALAVGDIVQAGISIRNSEVGGSRLVIEPRLLRLICTNGMTVPDARFAARHVGKRIEDETQFSDEAIRADDEAFWLMARDQVSNALSEVRFQEIVDKLSETMTGQKIEAPVAATETLQQRFALTDGEREAVLRNLVTDGDLSRWGMLNAVTATAKESENFDRRNDLEALGWEIANLSEREWAGVALA